MNHVELIINYVVVLVVKVIPEIPFLSIVRR